MSREGYLAFRGCLHYHRPLLTCFLNIVRKRVKRLGGCFWYTRGKVAMDSTWPSSRRRCLSKITPSPADRRTVLTKSAGMGVAAANGVETLFSRRRRLAELVSTPADSCTFPTQGAGMHRTAAYGGISALCRYRWFSCGLWHQPRGGCKRLRRVGALPEVAVSSGAGGVPGATVLSAHPARSAAISTHARH